MRFKRPGAAPLSILLPAGNNDAELLLPEAEDGGELLLLNVVQPTIGEITEFEVSGHSPMRFKIDPASRAARARLFAGEYEGRLVFSSGLRSEPRTFSVHTGSTTEVLREMFDPRSELVLNGDLELSEHQPTSLALYKLTSTGGSSERVAIWKTTLTPPDLSWRIDGLQAGTYEAQLANDAPLASTIVEVGEGESAQARLAAPSVQIVGTLAIGGSPAPAGTKIHFEIDEQRFETTTDERGGYSARAGKPGKYTARIESGKYLWTWTDSVSFVEGLNRFDWKIPGGSLRLTLRREDGKHLDETVQLQCSARGYHSAGPVMANEVAGTVVLLGLPFEAIKCSADTKSGLVSDELLVMLTPTVPSVDSTLRLRALAGKIDLRDSVGNPLSGARVNVGNITLDEDPPASGQYTLERSVPGAGMLITAKGHLPMCRQLRESDFPFLRLSMVAAGTIQATIRLTPKASRPPGLMHGVPGSECPIPLFAFDPVLRGSGPTSTDILLRLPEGNFQYQPYSLFPLQSFTVPGAPLELTRPK